MATAANRRESLDQGQATHGRAPTFAIGPGLSPGFQLHALALLAVLLILFPFVVGDTPWSADIGARLYQAQHLLDTGNWAVPHPIPRADSDGLFFPLHLSSATEESFQYVVFPKHPVLVWITAGLFQHGGFRAVVVVQTLATFGAAAGTARLVGRTRPSLANATLWFTGLISPLFFDAFVGYAHSLAAALLIWAAVLTLQFIDPRPTGSAADGLFLVGAALLVGLACLIRTEAALAGLALAGGVLAGGFNLWTRSRWLVAFTAIGLSTAVTAILDRFIKPATTGTANPGSLDPWGGLPGRIESFQRTWLSPGRAQADVLIIVIAALVLAVGLLGLQRPRGRAVEITLLVTFIIAVLRAGSSDPILIFGLVMACPLLIVGLIKGAPRTTASSETILCATTFGLYSLAVLATQYRFGGVAEWGGRYFAAGVPFAVAVAVPGLARALSGFPAPRARRIVVLAVAGAMVINLAGLRSLHHSRQKTEALAHEIAESMATVRLRGLGLSADSGLAYVSPQQAKPIVVTTIPAAGRLAWDEIDNGNWLLVDDDKLGVVAERLTELGVGMFTLVTGDATSELADIEPFYTVESWLKTDDAPGDVIIVSSTD